MKLRSDWSDLFLSATGRVARAPATAAAALLIGVIIVYQALVGPTLHLLTGWVVYPAVFYCGACVLSKRLHDRGRSGWWAALILVASVAAWPHPTGFVDFLAVVVLFWAVVELAAMPGEMGTNRFGPNPLRVPLAA